MYCRTTSQKSSLAYDFILLSSPVHMHVLSRISPSFPAFRYLNLTLNSTVPNEKSLSPLVLFPFLALSSAFILSLWQLRDFWMTDKYWRQRQDFHTKVLFFFLPKFLKLEKKKKENLFTTKRVRNFKAKKYSQKWKCLFHIVLNPFLA